MTNISQRMRTRKLVDEQLKYEMEFQFKNEFPEIDFNIWSCLCVSFYISGDKYEQWAHDKELDKKYSCKNIDFSEMTDDEILDAIKNNPDNKAEEIGKWIRVNFFGMEE